VRVFHGTTVVATHARSLEPFERVIDPAHYAGLWQTPSVALDISAAPLAGRDLADYDQRLVREVATARFLSQAETSSSLARPAWAKPILRSRWDVPSSRRVTPSSLPAPPRFWPIGCCITATH
jgi:hypothetical protein